MEEKKELESVVNQDELLETNYLETEVQEKSVEETKEEALPEEVVSDPDEEKKVSQESREVSLEVQGDILENEESVKIQAKKKLEKELNDAKDKLFAEPVIKYLLERCEDDSGLSEDVMQKHKSWEKCLSYIYSKASNQATGNYAAVRDDVVYEWAEDYYHLDDKALEEKKAKEIAEKKKKSAETAKKQKEEQKNRLEKQKKYADKKADDNNTVDKKNTSDDKKVDSNCNQETQTKEVAKKKSKELDGQMDLFSLMGM